MRRSADQRVKQASPGKRLASVRRSRSERFHLRRWREGGVERQREQRRRRSRQQPRARLDGGGGGGDVVLASEKDEDVSGRLELVDLQHLINS